MLNSYIEVWKNKTLDFSNVILLTRITKNYFKKISDNIEGFPPRPPFHAPPPQGFMRGPHPSMNPQAQRPPFYPGFVPRAPLAEQYGGSPQVKKHFLF